MKKLAIIFGLMFFSFFLINPALSLNTMEFDFDNDGSWDNEWALSNIGDTVTVNVYLTADPPGTTNIFYSEFYYDNDRISVDSYSCNINDWDNWCYIDEVGPPGSKYYQLDCSSFTGLPVTSSGLLIGSFDLRCIAGGDAQIYTDYTDPFSFTIDEEASATIHGPCVISISPKSNDVKGGETIQFSATVDGTCNLPSYSWQVTTDCGSTIDENGLYTAGDVMFDCSDTVTVIDSGNGDIQDIATVNISPWLTITPENETVGSGETIVFSGSYEPDFCNTKPIYCWSVESDIDSTISAGYTVDAKGYYTAGIADPPSAEDTVKLTGLCPDPPDTKKVITKVTILAPIITTTTSISTTTTTVPITTTVPVTTTIPITTTVASTTTIIPTTTSTIPAGPAITVLPSEVWRSRWIPLFYLMHIKGTETNFEPLTKVDYAPATSALSVFRLPPLVFPATQDILQIIFVMPSWLTNIWDEEEEEVTVTVDEVTDDIFTIKMLPFPLDEKKRI